MNTNNYQSLQPNYIFPHQSQPQQVSYFPSQTQHPQPQTQTQYHHPSQPQTQPFQPHIQAQPFHPQVQTRPILSQTQAQPQIQTQALPIQPQVQTQQNILPQTQTQPPVQTRPILSQTQAQPQVQIQTQAIQPQVQQTQQNIIPQTQAQPQLNNDVKKLTENIISNYISQPSYLSYIKKNIQIALNKQSDTCIFNHSILSLPNDTDNDILMKIKDSYIEYSQRSLENKIDRVFKHLCPVCVYFKFGLLSQDISRDIKLFSCSVQNNNNNNNNNNYNGPKQYQLGSFIHVYNPYPAERALQQIKNNHPSDSTAFPSGTLLIPTGKILIQLLALPQNILTNGLKICQVMSDEENVEDIRCYYRFIARNKILENGYYKRTISEDQLKKMNQTGEGEVIDEKKINLLKDIYKKLQQTNNIKNIPKTVTEESTVGIEIDKEDNFNMKNIFQNGEPLEYIKRGDNAEATDIKMKIFDLNPAFVSYLQSMINIQSHLENKSKNELFNIKMYNEDDEDENASKLKSNYISLWKPTAPILNTVYYDLLMMGFYNELDIKRLSKVPPFNERCVLIQQNILVVNSKGDCIMTTDTTNDQSLCSIFNKVLRHTNIPIQQKSISTVSSQNLNDKGNPPLPKFSDDVIETVVDRLGMRDNDKKDDEVDDKYKNIFNVHKKRTESFHNNLKNNLDRLKNYFCNFQDDMGDDIPTEGNEIIYDIASRIFPQFILNSTQNKHMHSLHFADQATTKPILEGDQHPNCVYVKNLGFVNLINLCNNTPLILKNGYIYIDNLVKRDVPGYFNKTSDNCLYKAVGDDEDTTRTFSNINITTIPEKRKFNSDMTIDLVNKKFNNFDYTAYQRLGNCPNPNDFNDYVTIYGGNTTTNHDNNNCLRKI